MKRNWKTTLSGIALIATGIAMYVNGNVEGALSSVLGGIGLIFAKDYNITGVS